MPSLRGAYVRLAVLCSESLRQWQDAAAAGQAAGVYPYGMEHLTTSGFQLTQRPEPDWVARPLRRKLRDVVEHRYGAPLLRTILSLRTISRADISLAVLETDGFAYSRMRKLHIPPMSSVPLVMLSCWLAHNALTSDEHRLARLRRWTAGADLLVYLSRNQGVIYREKLGIPDDRLHYVPFGVPSEYYRPGDRPRDDYVAAIGQTGRDWTTLLKAASRTDVEFRIAARRSDFRSLRIPSNVRLLGRVGHAEYRRLLQQARIVVTCIHPHYAFPAGQSVLLQAMACGTPTIITETVPLADYTEHGFNTMLVSPHDPTRVVTTIEELLSDDCLRTRIGKGGLQSVRRRFNAQAMWNDVANAMRTRFATGK